MSLESSLKSFHRNLTRTNDETAAHSDTFHPAGELSIEAAFEVYREGYRLRLTEALADTFQAVRWMTGPEEFEILCKDFIHLHPSESFDLADYGQEFPHYLERSSQRQTFMRDLAQFEWIFKELFHSEPVMKFPPSPPPQTCDFFVRFAPSMRLFESTYSVYKTWNLREAGPAQCALAPLCSEHLLVYKKTAGVYVKELSNEEYKILFGLSQGQSMEQTLEENLGQINLQQIQKLFHFIGEEGLIFSYEPL